MEYLPFDVQYWRDSSFALRATDEEFRAGMMLVWACWHQLPAASLPDDDHVLMAMSGLGRKAPLEEWLRIKGGVLQEWVLCSDGRYYHPRIAEKALTAWRGRTRARGGRATPDVSADTPTRVQKLRQEHKALRDALHDYYGRKMLSTASIDVVRNALKEARVAHPAVAQTEIPATTEALAALRIPSQPLARNDDTETFRETVTPIGYAPVSLRDETGVSQRQAIAIGKGIAIGIAEPVLQGENSEGQSDQVTLPDESGPDAPLPDPDDVSGNDPHELFPSLPGIEAPRIPSKRKRALACPVDALVDLYERKMPENPEVRKVTPERKRLIVKGWQEAATIDGNPFNRYSSVEDGLSAWGRFFEICAESDFLTGKGRPRAEGSPPFLATIDFLMKPGNIVKCLENKYHRI